MITQNEKIEEPKMKLVLAKASAMFAQKQAELPHHALRIADFDGPSNCTFLTMK